MAIKKKSNAMNSQTVGRMIQKAIVKSAELKAVQFLQSGSAAATGVVGSLNALAQGDEVSQRTGTVIQPVSLDVMMESYVGAYTDAVRYIIFYDTKFTGTDPTTNMVLATDFIGANYNFINVIQNKRFHILMDETVSLNGNGVGFDIRHKVIKNIPKCYYSGTSSSKASMSTNALFSIVIGYSTHVGYSLDTQLRFIDV